MIKITGYRIINGHTVTHKSRKRKHVKDIRQVEKYEYNTANRYTRKNNEPCECWAIYQTI